MRTVFIYLFLGLFLTFIQFSNAAPRKGRSLESDDFRTMMKNFALKLKPYINNDDNSVAESDESNEEEKKKIIGTIEFLDKSSEESSNEQDKEEEDNDKQAILSHFIDINHDKISQNSDEK